MSRPNINYEKRNCTFFSRLHEKKKSHWTVGCARWASPGRSEFSIFIFTCTISSASPTAMFAVGIFERQQIVSAGWELPLGQCRVLAKNQQDWSLADVGVDLYHVQYLKQNTQNNGFRCTSTQSTLPFASKCRFSFKAEKRFGLLEKPGPIIEKTSCTGKQSCIELCLVVLFWFFVWSAVVSVCCLSPMYSSLDALRPTL